MMRAAGQIPPDPTVPQHAADIREPSRIVVIASAFMMNVVPGMKTRIALAGIYNPTTTSKHRGTRILYIP
jgi:hypothetical protein